jgi:hypothetical protein
MTIRFDAGDGTPVVHWFASSDHPSGAVGAAGDRSVSHAYACRIGQYIQEWLRSEHTDDEGVEYMCAQATKTTGPRRPPSALPGRVAKVGVTLQDAVGDTRSTVIVLETCGGSWSMGIDTDFENPCLRKPEETQRLLAGHSGCVCCVLRHDPTSAIQVVSAVRGL